MNALLALFLRAVRDDLRSKSTYWMRAGFVALVLLFVQGSISLTQWAGAPGLQVFSRVLWMNVFFISLAGLSYFASAITEEKEDGTLGLLRMTDLDPLAILLGKSTGRLAGALLLLAVQLPFTILATSLGGVNLAQILAAYAMLGAYLFFLANLALIFSVLCRRTSLAATLTGATLLAFFWAPGLIADARDFSLSMTLLDYDTTATGLQKFVFAWWRGSPFVRADEILRTGFHGAAFAWQVWTDLALGAVCFLIAWALFDRFADRAAEGGAMAAGSSVRPPRRATSRRGRPWARPLVWKDFHYVAGGRLGALLKLALCGGLLAWCLWSWRDNGMSIQDFGYVAMGVMAFVWTVDLGITASRIFRVERRGQTLSSLALLPTSLARLARQKALGCLLASWPAVFFFLGGFALAAPDMWKSARDSWLNNSRSGTHLYELFLGFALPAACILCFVHLVAWLSLRVKLGALPLAIVISFVAMQMTVATLMFVNPHDASWVVLVLIALLLGAGVLHAGIGRRLEHLAAED